MACSPKAERMLEWNHCSSYSWAASTVVRLSPSGRQPRGLLFGMEMTGVWAAACPVFASCHSLQHNTVLPFICFLFLGNKIFSQIRPPVLKVIVDTEARWWCEYPSVIRWGFGRNFPAVADFFFTVIDRHVVQHGLKTSFLDRRAGWLKTDSKQSHSTPYYVTLCQVCYLCLSYRICKMEIIHSFPHRDIVRVG